MKAALFAVLVLLSACSTDPAATQREMERLERNEPRRVHPAKTWAQNMLGHQDIGYQCQDWDTNDDGYVSCDLVDHRTSRIYTLACPAAMQMFVTECKMRLR